jgi:integrase
MRLELKKHGDGRLRPDWFGVHMVGGRRRVATLCPWRGTPPESGRARDVGDSEFEASRAVALRMAEEAFRPERSEAEKTVLARRIYRSRYGDEVKPTPLSELPERWDTFSRRRRPCNKYAENCRRILRLFVTYMGEHAPDVAEVEAVTEDHVSAFIRAEEKRGLSGRTLNVTLIVLRAAFRRLAPYSSAREYLDREAGREEATVHREPFTPHQLTGVFAAASGDDLMRPLIVCAACTAMRRGDVALLRWRSVDLAAGFVTVKTAKSGSSVEIPILAPLRMEFERAQTGRAADGNAFVWPEAASMYRRSPDALDRRLRDVLARAGFLSPETIKKAQKALPALPAEETRCRGLEAIAVAAGWTEKRRERTREIFTRYMDGATVPAITVQLGIARGLVSMRLADVEKAIGAAVVRRPPPPAVIHGAVVEDGDDAGPRLRRGSLKGWHSFRTTWITLALAAGVPMELVRRVTGHAAADVVLKHYFRPGREAFKSAIAAAMPGMLLEAPKPVEEPWPEIAGRLSEKLTAKTWREVKAELAKIAKAGKGRDTAAA